MRRYRPNTINRIVSAIARYRLERELPDITSAYVVKQAKRALQVHYKQWLRQRRAETVVEQDEDTGLVVLPQEERLRTGRPLPSAASCSPHTEADAINATTVTASLTPAAARRRQRGSQTKSEFASEALPWQVVEALFLGGDNNQVDLGAAANSNRQCMGQQRRLGQALELVAPDDALLTVLGFVLAARCCTLAQITLADILVDPTTRHAHVHLQHEKPDRAEPRGGRTISLGFTAEESNLVAHLTAKVSFCVREQCLPLNTPLFAKVLPLTERTSTRVANGREVAGVWLLPPSATSLSHRVKAVTRTVIAQLQQVSAVSENGTLGSSHCTHASALRQLTLPAELESSYNGSALRPGFATAASSMELPFADINKVCYWSGPAYLTRYNRPTESSIPTPRTSSVGRHILQLVTVNPDFRTRRRPAVISAHNGGDVLR